MEIDLINNVITDIDTLMQRYIIRDGFVFSQVTFPANIYDAIVIKNPPHTPCSSPKIIDSAKSLQEHIDFINKYKIEKALIIAENIDFITKCPSLKYFRIIPSDNAKNDFDYSPLYHMPAVKSLSCATVYGAHYELTTSIDYSKINDLESVSISGSGHFNYNTIRNLKTLGISGYKESNLTNMFSGDNLDSLMIIQSNIKSLEGLQTAPKIKCLYLYYNSHLNDISALRAIKESITALRIENCNQIKDFSVLSELKNLEMLELSGNNTLANLDFIKSMKNLKTFIFSMNVLNGDLSPSQSLPFVRSLKDRKHYNLKDKNLPKGEFVHGNESIELWRRYD